MHILFTVQDYYPKISGVPVVVQYLAENLSKNKHHVVVATSRPKGTSPVENINGVDVHRFNIYKNKFHLYRGEDVQRYINFVINSGSDVIIIECTECVTTDILLPHLNGINSKIIFHSHGMSGFDSVFFAIKDNIKHTLGTTFNWINSFVYFNFIFLKAFERIDAFVCLSNTDSGINYVKRYAKKLYYLDNAADDIFFSDDIVNNVIGNYTTLSHDSYFLSCANYTVVKNQKELIKQFYLSESSKSFSLVCIGSSANAYYYECIKLISLLENQIGHRDVHLLYGVSRNDIPSIVRGASLYLVASRWEQYSISIIEAMSQGVPFISTDVGNASILPGGETISSVSDMHTCIDDIMNNHALFRHLSCSGQEFAYKNCRVGVAVERLIKIIYEVV